MLPIGLFKGMTYFKVRSLIPSELGSHSDISGAI